VEHARAEAALADLDRRLETGRSGIVEAAERIEALVREQREHEESLERLESLRGEASAQLESLFGERDALAAELRGLDENLSQATEAAEALEGRVRTLRRTTEERAEERHRLELARAEGEAAERSIRER